MGYLNEWSGDGMRKNITGLFGVLDENENRRVVECFNCFYVERGLYVYNMYLNYKNIRKHM